MSYIQDLVKKQIIIWFPETKILENHRPEWLIGLEIDLYLPELNLAIEVNGLQHYIKTDAFFKKESQFEMQLIRDHVKKKILENEKIKLILVKQGATMFNELCFKINYIFKNKPRIDKELLKAAENHWLNNRDIYFESSTLQEKRVDLLQEERNTYNFLIKNKQYKEAYVFLKSKACIVDRQFNTRLKKIYGK